MVLERIQIFAYRLECEIFRVFGYFVIFLAKNIVEISFRIVESKYCEAQVIVIDLRNFAFRIFQSDLTGRCY